jgi:hypothetical protein
VALRRQRQMCIRDRYICSESDHRYGEHICYYVTSLTRIE